MKIKLILAASDTDPLRKNDPFMPLSLPLLASAAPGHEYSIHDLLWESCPDFDEKVDLVGISMRLTAENKAYALAAEYRKRGVPVVIGGPQASAVPFRAIHYADAIAVGEGEELWPRIVEHVAAGNLRQFYVCSPKPFDAPGYTVYQISTFPDLSQEPIPARKLLMRRYTFDTVFATRGCPIGCDFCSVPRLFGTGFRHRPIGQVVAEINSFRNYYYLLDDTVFGKPSTYAYYLKLYESIVKLKKRRYWIGQGNLDAAGDEGGKAVIRRARDSGLLYAAIGMESISREVLERSGAARKMGYAQSADPVTEARERINFMQDLGIIVSGWFVVGYEADTIESYYQTLRFCLETNVIPAIFPVKALPGTPLYERLAHEGKLDDTKLINFRNPNIADNDVIAALRHIRKIGYSFRSILKRTIFYARRFKTDRIHKTIFALVLQLKLRGGLDITHDEFFREGLPSKMNIP